MTSKKNAYFVSDLHMFARRSSAHQYCDAIHEHARRAHTFVLGGDIFDFRWSTLDTANCTARAATEWLGDLVGRAPDCNFHFLMGNHDHHEVLLGRMNDLSDKHENLSWDPYMLRLGDSVFLHGDAADGDATHDRLVRSRERGADHAQRGKAANLAYDAVVGSGIHRTVPMVAYPNRRTARRLLKYLDEVGHGVDTGLRHVYFGHTHRSLDTYLCDSVSFHNGGAPIRGVPFRIVRVETPHR